MKAHLDLRRRRSESDLQVLSPLLEFCARCGVPTLSILPKRCRLSCNGYNEQAKESKMSGLC